MPPKPIGDRAMTNAERQARYAARQAEIEARLEASRLETIEGLRATLEEAESLLSQALTVIRSALKK